MLEGAVETIQKLRPVLYVEDDRQDQSPALRGLLRSLRYEVYVHRPPLFEPDNFERDSTNVFGNVVSLNLFCRPLEAEEGLDPEQFLMKKVMES